MSMSVGASSNALSYLQQLLQQASGSASSAASSTDPLTTLMNAMSESDGTANQNGASTDPFGGSAGFPPPPFGNSTMAALISLQGQSANGLSASSPSELFSKIDADGDGKISKSEFETALTGAGASASGADSLFAKLDANGDGTVSQDEMTNAAQGHHHAHGGGGAGGQSPLDALLSGAGADGATTQSATNADGSTTTTVTYADGTKIDMTTPAVAQASGTGSSDAASSSTGSSSSSSDQANANALFEQLMKLQSQMLSMAGSSISAFV